MPVLEPKQNYTTPEPALTIDRMPAGDYSYSVVAIDALDIESERAEIVVHVTEH